MRVSRIDISNNRLLKQNQQTCHQNISNCLNNKKNIRTSAYPSNYYLSIPLSFKGKEPLVGYDREKENIKNLLISPIKENRDDVPSGIIIYAADEIAGYNFISDTIKKSNIHLVEMNPISSDFEEVVYKKLEESKIRYLSNKQRTIILINETDGQMEDRQSNKRNISLMKDWLDNAAKIPSEDTPNAYATTLLFMTQNPKSISPNILEKISGFISLPLRNTENTEKLLKSNFEKYDLLNSNTITDEEINLLVQKLSPDSQLGAYSDSKISKMVKKANDEYLTANNKKIANILVSVIDKTKRDISSRIVKDSNETQKWLYQNHLVEGLEIQNVDDDIIKKIIAEKKNKYKADESNQLSERFDENNNLISSIPSMSIEDLKQVSIDGISIIDYWLDIDTTGKNIDRIKQNDRLKNLWFDSVIKDKEIMNRFVSSTLDRLQSENELIKLARTAYKDIIENDETINEEQKKILIRQQENMLFYKVVSNKLDSVDLLQMEINILDTIEQLDSERKNILRNAEDNIFSKLKTTDVLNSDKPDDVENVNYIFNLLFFAKQSTSFECDQDIDSKLNEFLQAKEMGDKKLIAESWKGILELSQQYFETEILNNITNTNIELLNSINEKVSSSDSKKIRSLTQDKNLTIEQREFIARYKNNKDFKEMINNPNVNIHDIIEGLVFYEKSNREVVVQNELEGDFDFNKIMSEQFKQINNDSKDLKIQTDRILTKLEDIDASICDFSDTYKSYASTMLDVQTGEFQQLLIANDYLNSINQNMINVNKYNNLLTRSKLLELSKDKNYKDIIPEMLGILPDKEQIDIHEFMLKIEELADKEKDKSKKKAIIRIGVAVAATVAIVAGAQYFSPEVVNNLSSQLPQEEIGVSLKNIIEKTNIAQKLGCSQLVSFAGRTITQIQDEIKNTKNNINYYTRMVKNHPELKSYGYQLEMYKKKLIRLYEELRKALSKQSRL